MEEVLSQLEEQFLVLLFENGGIYPQYERWDLGPQALQQGKIIFWYSDGLLDFKSGFYFFTKEHVVVYCKDWEDPAIIMSFNIIDDIYFKHSHSLWEDSTIYLTLNDDTEIYFPVSNEKGGGRRFYKTLNNIWGKRLKGPGKKK